MKKILFTTVIAISGLLISCKDVTTPAGSSTSIDENETKLAKNRQVFKAIETGDIATLDSLISDNSVDHMGPNGTEMKGGDSIRHMLADMHNHMKDMKVNVIADAANGDYVFAMEEMTGTTTDSTFGMPAGTNMDETGVDVVKIKDGKMIEHWAFADANAMMKMIKGMPPIGDKMMKDTMNKK